MAIITLTHVSQQATFLPAVETITPSFTKGGILLALNAVWIGTELIDSTVAGTIEEAFKPGSLTFSIGAQSTGTQSLISIQDPDQHIIPQGSSFSYQHPEIDNLRNCDFTHFLRPRPISDGFVQGLIQAGDSIIVTTQIDPGGYPANFTPGKHRAQYDLEILAFE